MSPAKSATGARARIPRSKSATKANRLRSQSVPKPAFSPFGTTPTEREKKGLSLKSQDLIEIVFFYFKETEAGHLIGGRHFKNAFHRICDLDLAEFRFRTIMM